MPPPNSQKKGNGEKEQGAPPWNKRSELTLEEIEKELIPAGDESLDDERPPDLPGVLTKPPCRYFQSPVNKEVRTLGAPDNK